MSVADRETFSKDVDTLAKRIETRLRELRKRGDRAQLHGELTGIAERHNALRGKLAVTPGQEWEQAKHDLTREHGSLFDEFVKFEQQLDADAANPPDRRYRSGLV